MTAYLKWFGSYPKSVPQQHLGENKGEGGETGLRLIEYRLNSEVPERSKRTVQPKHCRRAQDYRGNCHRNRHLDRLDAPCSDAAPVITHNH